MNLTANDALVVEFFKAHPQSCIRSLEASIKVEDFTSPADFRAFCKGCHSRAHALHREGVLTRTLQTDPESGLNVWHYSLNTNTATKESKPSKGYKALLEEEREKWKEERIELQEAAEMGLLLQHRAEEERDEAMKELKRVKLERDNFQAEVARLRWLLEGAKEEEVRSFYYDIEEPEESGKPMPEWMDS